jgi:outer membrane protein assembly factor BamD
MWRVFVAIMFFGVLACNPIEKLKKSADVEAQLNKADELYSKKKYADAAILYEVAMPLLRGNPRQEEVYYRYANCYYKQKMYTSAAYYFKQFSTSFRLSERREESDYMSAYCSYLQSPVYRLDQKATYDAIDGLQIFINTYPNSTRVEEANKVIDELRAKLEFKSYNEGLLYFKTNQYPSTIRVFENLLKDFPETKRVEEIRYLMAKSAYLYALNSVIIKQRERFEEFLVYANVYKTKHSEGKDIAEINSLVKQAQSSIKQLTNVGY